MPSRMEKYYRQNSDVKKRSQKNVDLYKTIYDNMEYSNVEGISIIEKNDTIDIEKIRELVNGPNRSKKEPIKPREISVPSIEPEIKNYDIHDVLDKAKNERPQEDNKMLNTQYNILKNLDLNHDIDLKDYSDDDLKTMIEAITNTSKINKTGDLFDDLKSLNNTTVGNLLKEDVEEQREMDTSFFTSSLSLKNEDYEDLKTVNKNVKKSHNLSKVLLFILLVAVITGIMLLCYHFLTK